MSRKAQNQQERQSARPRVDWKALEVVHPDAAGIDIGGSEHWVAISPDRDEQPVRCFDCFTADLEQMADWLKARGVRSVAMQSTGVYWIAVFEILQQRGMEVYFGECTAHQEPARTQERHRGMSMAFEVAHLWAVTEQLPAE